jgi:subtilase family serine protease
VIKNVGDASTNVSRVSWQVVKGPLVYEGQLPPSSGGGVLGGSLAPGATTTGLLEYFGPGQVIAGTYELTITVDATNSLNESNEANNGLTTSLPILTSNRYTGQPDLRTTASATEDTSNQCSSARRYDVTSVTTNAGTFPAYVHGNFVVQASTGLTTLHNEGYWILINPGASKTIVYSASLAFGTSKQFTFLADPKELVREGTDANNLYTLTIDAPPKSASGTGDLVVSEAFFEHTPTNGLYWLQVTLKNQGPGSVTICEYSWSTQNAPAGLSWSANAPQFPTTLAAGQTWKTPTSARQSLPSGTFSVTIQVNPSGAVPETNTGNNLHTFTVRIPEDVRIRR